MEIADRIVAELEIEHFFNIQLVGDYVIEINPRISTVVYQEDLNIPYLGVKRALGEISADELVALRSRIRPGPDGAALLRPARVGRLTRAAPVDARPLLPHPEPPPTRGHRHGAMPGVTCQCRDRAGCEPVSPPMSSADARTQTSATPRPRARRRRPTGAADDRREAPPTPAPTSRRPPAARHALPGQHGRRPVDDGRGAPAPRRRRTARRLRALRAAPRGRRLARPLRRLRAPPGDAVARASRSCSRRPTSSTSSSASRSCRGRCSSRRCACSARSP